MLLLSSTHIIQIYALLIWVQMLYLICTQIIENGLQHVVVKETNMWVPFLDINQFFKHLDSMMIIVLSLLHTYFAILQDYNQICFKYTFCFYQGNHLHCLKNVYLCKIPFRVTYSIHWYDFNNLRLICWVNDWLPVRWWTNLLLVHGERLNVLVIALFHLVWKPPTAWHSKASVS